MEQTREREWKSFVCPEGRGETRVRCEWDVISEKGRILKRTLAQIDCCNIQLCLFGGKDCQWGCEEIVAKRER